MHYPNMLNALKCNAPSCTRMSSPNGYMISAPSSDSELK